METAISDPAVAWFLSKVVILVAIILIVSGPYLLYAVLAAINWWHCRTDGGSEKEKDSEGSPNGMAADLKSAGLMALGVRFPRPPHRAAPTGGALLLCNGSARRLARPASAPASTTC